MATAPSAADPESVATAAREPDPALGTDDLDRLLSLSRDLFCVTGIDGSVRRINDAFTRGLGWSQEDVRGLALEELLHENDRATCRRAFERLADGRSESCEVRLRTKTGEYRWHFQSIHHGIWDMDNVMAPVLADVRIHGHHRKIVIYGSKCGMYYILDRRDGSAPLGIDELPVPQDPRQKTWPTQPFPRQGAWTETRIVDQPLGTAIPGDPNRAVPNYIQGALYSPHWDIPVLSIPGHGGCADWNHQSFSHSAPTGLCRDGHAGRAPPPGGGPAGRRRSTRPSTPAGSPASGSA